MIDSEYKGSGFRITRRGVACVLSSLRIHEKSPRNAEIGADARSKGFRGEKLPPTDARADAAARRTLSANRQTARKVRSGSFADVKGGLP